MMGQKTASLVVLLNLFSLTAHADAFYDALKAGGKYDSKTAASVRASTIDADRRNKVNAETANNPNFVPLSSLPKPYTDAELKKMRDQEAGEPETADMKADEETDARLKKEAKNNPPKPLSDSNTKTAEAPPAPTKGKGPVVLDKPSSAPIKVTSDDPDEVTFGGDDAAAAPAAKKSNPAPVKTSKLNPMSIPAGDGQ